MPNLKTVPSSLTKEQTLAAIKALAANDLEITHGQVRNQLLSSGFRPNAEDLVLTSSRTFAWLKKLSILLIELRFEGEIEVVSSPGRKGTKYRLVEKPAKCPEARPRQMSLPEYSSTEYLAQIAESLQTTLKFIGISGESRDILQAIASDLAETKELLKELIRAVTEPEPVYNGNGNGKNGNRTIEAIVEAETAKPNGKRR